MGATILVVDDNSGFRACARRLLEGEGYRVAEAIDGGSALVRARELRPKLALVDVHLADGDGVELSTRLAALDAAPVVVLISSHDRSDLEPLAAGTGVRGVLPKDELSGQAIEALLG